MLSAPQESASGYPVGYPFLLPEKTLDAFAHCCQDWVVTLDRSGKIRSGGLTMTAPLSLPTCPNPACEQPHVIRNGSSKGRRRYQCRGCGRFFGETEGTPMYRLHTPVAEVAQALLVVMRRGSLRAAEEITGHKYETIGEWLRRASEHAEAL